MAKARMLHKKISISSEVNKLSLPARLLFTWMIPHADDEGRLKGSAEYIKASVVPMTNWTFKRIKGYLEEIKNTGLIHYWQQNSEWFIEFAKWIQYQQIRKDRFEHSNLPSFSNQFDNRMTTNGQPKSNLVAPQLNRSESNEIKSNVIESSDKNSSLQEERPSKEGLAHLLKEAERLGIRRKKQSSEIIQ